MNLNNSYWVMLGLGCLLCGSCTRSGNPSSASGQPSCPSQKVEAFRLIVEETKKLPSSDEYYRDKPPAVQELFLRTTSRQVDTIDGMIAVFRIIKFDPAADRDGANVIYNLYQELAEERSREPYVRLLRSIEESIRPIINTLEEHSRD